MKSVTGYVVAVVGLVIMLLGFGTFGFKVGLLESLGDKVITLVGVAFVAVGVVLAMDKKGGRGKSRNVKHAKEEVPIYEGEGKKRRIVGYHRGGD